MGKKRDLTWGQVAAIMLGGCLLTGIILQAITPEPKPARAKAPVPAITQPAPQPGPRHGLSLEQRQALYREHVANEYKTDQESTDRYPNDIQGQLDYINAKRDERKAALAKKYKLTSTQLEDVLTEGVRAGWPKKVETAAKPSVPTTRLKELDAGFTAMRGLNVPKCKSEPEGCLTVLNVLAKALDTTLNGYSLTPEETARAKQYRTELAALQQKALPLIRDGYGAELRKMFWQHDVSARTYGKGFRTLELTGYYFASKANVSQAYQALYPLLMKLRMTEVRFQWHDGADKYDYYRLKDISPDHILLTWGDDNLVRQVVGP